MPLWNVELEVHTGRILQGVIGPACILIVPVLGSAAVWILVSDVILWFRRRTAPEFRPPHRLPLRHVRELMTQYLRR